MTGEQAQELMPPIEALAEHLCARRPCGDTPENVADWLDYSLNRCGLMIVRESEYAVLRASRPQPTEETVERIAYLEDALLEATVRAHKWMEAHDKLAAGKPYDLPTPADVPDALARAALSALPRADTGTGWQPIEAAPKDTLVLTLNASLPGAFVPWVGNFDSDEDEWHSFNLCYERAFGKQRPFAPTHWMPLPSPPSGQAPEQGRDGTTGELREG
jgi:hypothetical protein